MRADGAGVCRSNGVTGPDTPGIGLAGRTGCDRDDRAQADSD
jgi:hypothetical protein